MKKEFVAGVIMFILAFLLFIGFYEKNKNERIDMIVSTLTNLSGDQNQNYITNMIFFHTQALDLTSWYIQNGKNEKFRSLASATYSLKKEEMSILSGFAKRFGATEKSYFSPNFPKKNLDKFYLQNIVANHQMEINLSKNLTGQVSPDIKIYAKKVQVALSSQLEQITKK